MDISDGLLADLGHICRTSQLGADIEWPRVPLSDPAARIIAARPDLRERVIAGGDDYELLLTVADGDVPAATRLAERERVQLTRVGAMRTGAGVRIVDENGAELRVSSTGYRHF